MLAVEGYIPGWCGSTSLSVNNRFLIGTDNEFKAQKTWLVDWTELSDYTRACGLQKMYPFGMNLLACPFNNGRSCFRVVSVFFFSFFSIFHFSFKTEQPTKTKICQKDEPKLT